MGSPPDPSSNVDSVPSMIGFTGNDVKISQTWQQREIKLFAKEGVKVKVPNLFGLDVVVGKEIKQMVKVCLVVGQKTGGRNVLLRLHFGRLLCWCILPLRGKIR